MRFLGKNKNDYLYANFANVLIIRWYLPASNFSSTMLYCIHPDFLLKVIYLPRLDFKPVNFLRVCCLLIDASSSWFLRWCNQNLRKPLACVWLMFCMDSRFTLFLRKFLECFQKSLFSSGLTYFVTQKLTVYFLRSTGFSLLYANFDNLLEIRCDQS